MAGWPVLEDSSSKPTRRSILKGWPKDSAKPSEPMRLRWLEKGLIERSGAV